MRPGFSSLPVSLVQGTGVGEGELTPGSHAQVEDTPPLSFTAFFFFIRSYFQVFIRAVC